MIEHEKAREAVWQAADLSLYGSLWFARLPINAVEAACNGCGPEWMSEAWRRKLTDWLDIFFTAFCVHDCRFMYDNNGSREKFDLANQELEKNCLLLADDKYAWHDPRRYIWRHRARLVGYACREFGWSAWRDAYGEYEKLKQGEMK